MANNNLGLDLKSAKGGIAELKDRLLFVFGSLILFRLGSFIPLPGINATLLTKFIEKQTGTFMEMFNIFSGGALSRASIFTLGIMPYISASIIVQLLTVVHPRLTELKKEGEAGHWKINQYTRYGTLLLAIFQSIGIVTRLPQIPDLVFDLTLMFYFTAIVSLVTGTIFLMWLGEQITEKGIGNGISMIIFAGIVAGLPPAIGHTLEQVRQGDLPFIMLLIFALLVFLVTYFVVFMERGQRRIVVNYAQRQQGSRLYATQSTHLPLKVNLAGVLPAIFASSIVLFPGTIFSWFGEGTSWKWFTAIYRYLQPGQPLYVLLYASAIIFFCFFYLALIVSPRETADNLKKSGAFIPGIRPGEKTANYLEKIMIRLTLVGALYITFICLIPELIRNTMKVPFYFGGTSLLIVVVVIMDFLSQVQTLIMSKYYESALKKANLKIK